MYWCTSLAWSARSARRGHEVASRGEGRRLMERKATSTKNLRYTANPSFAKTPEFSKTSDTISRVKAKTFRFFYCYFSRFHLRTHIWQCGYRDLKKFVSLNTFDFSSYVTLSKNKAKQKFTSNHELCLAHTYSGPSVERRHKTYYKDFCFWWLK